MPANIRNAFLCLVLLAVAGCASKSAPSGCRGDTFSINVEPVR